MIPVVLDAVRQGYRIQFRYKNIERVVEIHTVGTTKEGRPVMRAWQVRGGSSGGSPTPWRIFLIDEAEAIKVLDERSHAPREGYRRGDPSIFKIEFEV